MKKITLSLLFILILTLCSCASNKDVPLLSETEASTESSKQQVIEATHETEMVEESTSPIALEPVYVYSDAIEYFLEPFDDCSWDRSGNVEFIMLHFTSAIVEHRDDPFNMQYIRQTFLDYKISVHYIIDRDGTIYCYMPENRAAWHAGYGEWNNDPKYTNDINPYSIGIELLAIGSESDMSTYLTSEEYAQINDDWKGFTDAQYKALNPLIDDLCERYDVPRDKEHIIGHEEFSPSKNDPGELFDWNKIVPQSIS